VKAERAAGLTVVAALAGMLAWNGVLVVRDFAGMPTDHAEIGGPAEGAAAPELRVFAPDGTPATLAGLRGQVVLVDFWATWCGPCQVSMPRIEELWRAHRPRGFTVMSIDVDGRRDAANAATFMGQRALTTPLFLDDGPAQKAYGVEVLPQMVLVDRDGKVAWTHLGSLDDAGAAALSQRVNELVAR
jgi:thiol-disulfide isomerase/thioredoxin